MRRLKGRCQAVSRSRSYCAFPFRNANCSSLARKGECNG